MARPRGRTDRETADWLLGGPVRRLILERLADGTGWSARALAAELDAGEAWVYEVFRALRPVGALEQTQRGRYRLSRSGLGLALRAVVIELEEFRGQRLDRPPSRSPESDG